MQSTHQNYVKRFTFVFIVFWRFIYRCACVFGLKLISVCLIIVVFFIRLITVSPFRVTSICFGNSFDSLLFWHFFISLSATRNGRKWRSSSRKKFIYKNSLVNRPYLMYLIRHLYNAHTHTNIYNFDRVTLTHIYMRLKAKWRERKKRK